MSRRKVLSIGVAVAVVIAIAVAFLWPAPARTVAISVAATPGTKVTGSYEVDGVASVIDTEGSAEFVATGRSVTFSVQNGGQAGEMTVRISRDGGGYASATATAGGGVRGGYKSGKGVTRPESFWATNSQAGP